MTVRARRDIDIAATWYGDKDRRAGQKWFLGIQRAISTLTENPHRCAVAHEAEDLGVEIRELLYGSGRHKTHRILFRIVGNLVEVMHVRHFSQDDLTGDDL